MHVPEKDLRFEGTPPSSKRGTTFPHGEKIARSWNAPSTACDTLSGLLLVGVRRRKHDNKEREQKRDEVGIGDQPSLMVHMFGMFFLRAITPLLSSFDR